MIKKQPISTSLKVGVSNIILDDVTIAQPAASFAELRPGVSAGVLNVDTTNYFLWAYNGSAYQNVVLSQSLTGLDTAAGSVSSADTVLSAIGKTTGNIALKAPISALADWVFTNGAATNSTLNANMSFTTNNNGAFIVNTAGDGELQLTADGNGAIVIKAGGASNNIDLITMGSGKVKVLNAFGLGFLFDVSSNLDLWTLSMPNANSTTVIPLNSNSGLALSYIDPNGIQQTTTGGDLNVINPVTFSLSTNDEALSNIQSNVTNNYVPKSELAQNNGVATLDAGGKLLLSQLPIGALLYQGTWNASTNTPTLANGTGTVGYYYICSVPGTADFGAGPIAFDAGDYVLYSAGNIWQEVPTGSKVVSVNGEQGAVVLDAADVGADPAGSATAAQIAAIAASLQKSNNLSDLTNVGTARTSLGLGTIATLNTGNVTAVLANNPTASNDFTQGYIVGSKVKSLATDLSFTCIDNATGAAVWSSDSPSSFTSSAAQLSVFTSQSTLALVTNQALYLGDAIFGSTDPAITVDPTTGLFINLPAGRNYLVTYNQDTTMGTVSSYSLQFSCTNASIEAVQAGGVNASVVNLKQIQQTLTAFITGTTAGAQLSLNTLSVSGTVNIGINSSITIMAC